MNYFKRIFSQDNLERTMNDPRDTDTDLKWVNILILNPLLFLSSLTFVLLLLAVPVAAFLLIMWLVIEVHFLFAILLLPYMGLLMLGFEL